MITNRINLQQVYITRNVEGNSLGLNETKISKDIDDLNNVIGHFDLNDIYKALYAPTKEEYILFSSIYSTFTKIDYILGHKPCLSKFDRNEITQWMFSDHNGIK